MILFGDRWEKERLSRTYYYILYKKDHFPEILVMSVSWSGLSWRTDTDLNRHQGHQHNINSISSIVWGSSITLDIIDVLILCPELMVFTNVIENQEKDKLTLRHNTRERYWDELSFHPQLVETMFYSKGIEPLQNSDSNGQNSTKKRLALHNSFHFDKEPLRTTLWALLQTHCLLPSCLNFTCLQIRRS